MKLAGLRKIGMFIKNAMNSWPAQGRTVMARSNAIARHFPMLAALAIFTSVPAGVGALAADTDILAQPWAKWDSSKEKPVPGGYLRLAGPQYICKMNPNHWPGLEWMQ